uniref:Uncharacterized protein n=1 Tax=Mycena chlorophos TaxID=658473 RepID=A0ABQ0L757_MYCCL|nr:predicted protein [Mycena chlorophos]
MKSCLKNSQSAPRARRVSFGEKMEVFEVENWDRTPFAANMELSYDDLCELEEVRLSPVDTPEWPSSVPLELVLSGPGTFSPAVPTPRRRARSFYAPRFAAQAPPIVIPPRFRAPASTFQPKRPYMIVNGLEVPMEDCREPESPDSDFDFLQHGHIPFGVPSSPSLSPTSPSSTYSLSPDPFAAAPLPRGPVPPRLDLAFDQHTYSITKVPTQAHIPRAALSSRFNPPPYANPSAGHAYVSVPA